MIAKEFDEVNLRIAENQDEYETLPAFCNKQEGTAMFCFELDEDERKQVEETGLIYMKVLTGNGKLQPIAMSTIKDELYVPVIWACDTCKNCPCIVQEHNNGVKIMNGLCEYFQPIK